MKRARTQTIELPSASPAHPNPTKGSELVEAILAEQASVDPKRRPEARKRNAKRGAKPGAQPRIDGMVIGKIARVSGPGEAVVELPAGVGGGRKRAPVRARSTIKLTDKDAGREATLMFDGGDPKKPIVMGLLQAEGSFAEAEIDGERIELTAQKEIVLRCGKASITLTRAGKVLIRGAYVSSRSSGVNRVKGGSVEIN